MVHSGDHPACRLSDNDSEVEGGEGEVATAKRGRVTVLGVGDVGQPGRPNMMMASAVLSRPSG